MTRRKKLGRATAGSFALLVVVGLASPPCAQAQGYRLEITPTLGYRWGGHLGANDTALLDVDTDLEGGASYGLMFDVPLSRHFQVELLADHQEAELRRGKLFAPDFPGIDLDVDYYQIGLLWEWHPPRVRPYVVLAVGVTDLDPGVSGVSGETRFSASLGGGVKVPVTDRVGVRLEFRAFGTDTSDWGCRWGCDDDWWHGCDGGGCDWADNGLSQASIRLGVTFSI
jgi:opacity protein-like surface antigen